MKFIKMKNQVFKGEVLSRTVVKNNILRIWEMTDSVEREDWYQTAYDWAYQTTWELIRSFTVKADGQILNRVIGVLAALSPMKRWEQNQVCAIDFLYNGDCGQMKAFCKKAERIMESNGSDEEILTILNGRKISAFYLNIRYPDKANHVTIDRHALSVALGYWTPNDMYQGITAAQYNFFVQCYILAGAKVGVSGVRMQSATWVKWRKIKQDYK